MSRVREFGDLRQSRQTQRGQVKPSYVSQKNFYTPKQQFDKQSQASSTHSHYICLNCININMSSEKKRQHRDRQFLERSRYQQVQKSRRTFDSQFRRSIQKKAADDKHKFLDINRQMIQEHNLARSREKEAIQSENQKQIQNRKLNDKRLEQDAIEKEKQRKQFRDTIQKQIEEKNQSKLRQQMEDRYQKLPEDNQEDGFEAVRRKQDQYKKGLIDQIKSNQQKKILSQLQRKNNEKAAFALIELAEQRAKQMLSQENKRKLKYQQEIKDLAKASQQRRIAAQLKVQQERVQALIAKQYQQKQSLQNQKAKADQINRYKWQIRKQIDEKEKQRNTERRDRFSNTSYLNMTIEEIEKRLCDSCEKVYPKKFMTKIKK